MTTMNPLAYLRYSFLLAIIALHGCDSDGQDVASLNIELPTELREALVVVETNLFVEIRINGGAIQTIENRNGNWSNVPVAGIVRGEQNTIQITWYEDIPNFQPLPLSIQTQTFMVGSASNQATVTANHNFNLFDEDNDAISNFAERESGTPLGEIFISGATEMDSCDTRNMGSFGSPRDNFSSGSCDIDFASDSDDFTFTVTQPGFMRLSHVGSSTLDTVGNLLDSSGGIVVFNDDSGPGLRFEILAELQPGNYTLRVRAFGDETTGAYAVQAWFTEFELPRMLEIGGSSFTMGSPADEPSRFADEGPQFSVTMDRFHIGVFEVTFDEYDRFTNATGRPPAQTSGFGTGTVPVINVTWQDATDFAAWLSTEAGLNYSLPTEAEWEFAARGGTTTPFSTGQTITTDQANFDGNFTYNGSATGTFRERTTTVGTFAPNDFGLFDMHGNVWEFTCSAASDGYDALGQTRAQVCASNPTDVVTRGGSWFNAPTALRAALRLFNTSDESFRDTGFRLVRRN